MAERAFGTALGMLLILALALLFFSVFMAGVAYEADRSSSLQYPDACKATGAWQYEFHDLFPRYHWRVDCPGLKTS